MYKKQIAITAPVRALFPERPYWDLLKKGVPDGQLKGFVNSCEAKTLEDLSARMASYGIQGPDWKNAQEVAYFTSWYLNGGAASIFHHVGNYGKLKPIVFNNSQNRLGLSTEKHCRWLGVVHSSSRVVKRKDGKERVILKNVPRKPFIDEIISQALGDFPKSETLFIFEPGFGTFWYKDLPNVWVLNHHQAMRGINLVLESQGNLARHKTKEPSVFNRRRILRLASPFVKDYLKIGKSYPHHLETKEDVDYYQERIRGGIACGQHLTFELLKKELELGLLEDDLLDFVVRSMFMKAGQLAALRSTKFQYVVVIGGAGHQYHMELFEDLELLTEMYKAVILLQALSKPITSAVPLDKIDWKEAVKKIMQQDEGYFDFPKKPAS
ncbi:hypothetical protein ACFL96_03765 [Thermoproteota archaeon]